MLLKILLEIFLWRASRRVVNQQQQTSFCQLVTSIWMLEFLSFLHRPYVSSVVYFLPFSQSVLVFLQDSSTDGIQIAASQGEPHDPGLPSHVLGPSYTLQVLPHMVCIVLLLQLCWFDLASGIYIVISFSPYSRVKLMRMPLSTDQITLLTCLTIQIWRRPIWYVLFR